ncbi:TPA: AAA family ATPase [Campylobacter coli]|uniref:McrB family protein n=1 Tax=Campylobacter coli TaxID=195 RepID=UPI000717297B|nr:AAA family ATPase [Campylobacter coli]EAH8237502.1 AAA family ATPase [Campylobacter coli]EAH8241154.1 AAA family ATPase [Campylobacter coli]EAH8242960.1 AAA family ATPase [Campylobacter coli]EAH8245048.1 AAA family ATPase [Campylobacter coli]EAH8248440.1 AAA family ATPase [Campylobacter coli]
MIEFLNEDRKKFKEYLIDFFHNAYNSDKLSSKDEIVNFDFLKNYGFCVKLSYGKGTISKIPRIIFIRTDTQEYKASYGIYVYCGIKRENGEIIVCIGESEDKTINYLAKNKVDDYNTQFNKKTYDYKNLNNDIDLIIDKIIENMQWFAKLPLNEIQDRNDLSKSNNKEIRNDGSEMSNKKENKNLSLNQILYGPPGTGKTYHTIDKALEILGENLESRDRDEKKAKFDEYVKDGQIVFITFHQSYGYEEFVEGIKPMINNEANSQEIQYEIKDGIFKDICNRALENYENSNLNTEELREKIKLREKVEKFLNRLLETNEPISKTKGGNFFINSFNNNTIEIYSEDVERFDGIFKLSLSTFITLLKSNIEFNSAVEMFKKVFDRDYADRTHTYYFNLVNKFKEYEKQAVLKTKDNKISSNSLNSYIIIIDEINRGNVSKIFGELITLIEPSKRIGESEELKVALPYSGKKFGVPKNVYILGTMNTADRSITSLDTALRRRFEFVEMMPDPDLLKNVFICKDVENPNKDEDYLGDDAKTEGFAEILQNILISINKRIEFLLDREKTIGHAFFMSEAVKFNKDNWCKPDEYEEDWYVLSISKLKSIFQNKIIPLLQEYFYNDYALISAVLNDNGMIEKCEKDDKYLQKIKNLDNVDSEKIIYNIASFDNKIWNDIKTYQAIYNDGENQSKNDKQ